MTIVVTRNVVDRFRGFLASCMCEVAPGVYVAPRMTQGIRERVWGVLESWHTPAPEGEPERSILMGWRTPRRPGGLAFRSLGAPVQDLSDHDGVFLARREIDEGTRERVEAQATDEAAPSDAGA